MVYLSKSKLRKHIKRINKILDELNKNLGSEWDISYNLVGSASRNLVIPTNDGYDFDYHIYLNKYPQKLSPKEIKNKFRTQLDIIVKRFFLTHCEDSTHVLTTKNVKDGKVLYSYDFAILRKTGKKSEILKNRKKGKLDDYQFIEIPDYPEFIKKLKKIDKPDHLDFLRDRYYSKKMNEQNKTKDNRTLSISLLLVSLNDTIQKYKIN